MVVRLRTREGSSAVWLADCERRMEHGVGLADCERGREPGVMVIRLGTYAGLPPAFAVG